MVPTIIAGAAVAGVIALAARSVWHSRKSGSCGCGCDGCSGCGGSCGTKEP